MKRLYTIRFYQKHDMDLLSLRLRGVDLADAVHQSLIAFVEGRDMALSLPRPRGSDCGVYNSTASKVEKKISLDDEDETDIEIIQILERINEGSWNNFFKNILRMYLWHPYADNYVKSAEDLKFFEDKVALYKQNKEIYSTKKELRRDRKSKDKVISPPKRKIECPVTPLIESKTKKEEVYDDIIDLDEWDIPATKTKKDPAVSEITTSMSSKKTQPQSIVKSEPTIEPESLPIIEQEADIYQPESKEDDDMDDITKAFSELLI